MTHRETRRAPFYTYLSCKIDRKSIIISVIDISCSRELKFSFSRRHRGILSERHFSRTIDQFSKINSNLSESPFAYARMYHSEIISFELFKYHASRCSFETNRRTTALHSVAREIGMFSFAERALKRMCSIPAVPVFLVRHSTAPIFFQRLLFPQASITSGTFAIVSFLGRHKRSLART